MFIMTRTVDIGYVEVVAETEDAVCVDFYEEEIWIPRSQIADDSEVSRDALRGDSGNLSISEWFATKKDLI